MTGEEYQVERLRRAASCLGRVVLYPYGLLEEVVEGENLPRYDLCSVGDGEAGVIRELRHLLGEDEPRLAQ